MKNIFLCVPITPGKGIVMGLVNLLLILKNKVGTICLLPAEGRQTCRNMLRLQFLKSNYDYMLTLDSDVIPPYQQLLKMVKKATKQNRAFTSGAVPGLNNHGVYWMAFEKTDKDEFITVNNLKNPRMYKVDATGLGCVLIRRDILEKTHFSNIYNNSGLIIRSEDLDFCEQVQYLGYNVYLDFACQCDHIAMKGVSLLSMI